MQPRIRARAITTAAALGVLALVATTPRPAAAQMDITGEWTGTFEFIVLGKEVGIGPASVFDRKLRGMKGEPARVGEGTIAVRIRDQVGGHFVGRWTVERQSSEFVCTMFDDRDFICGGRRTSASGRLNGDGSLRMCWTANGVNATAGCADLELGS